MIFDKKNDLKKRIEEVTGKKVYTSPRIFEDTSNFFNIMGGDVVRLAENDYLITGDAKEGRFGLDIEPKMWVKYGVDLTSGKKKVIKLVFDEQFSTRLGFVLIKAVRSAVKEGEFLDATNGHPNFMQGFCVQDSRGNCVRILDFVRGKSLFSYIRELTIAHEEYYWELFPKIFKNVIECIEGMQFASARGVHHGDIRNDHILVDFNTGKYVWIDFDYSVNFSDYDLWCIGNIITFIAAGGLLLKQEVERFPERYPPYNGTIDEGDCSMYHRYRIANVRKIYPYVSRKLNEICLKYSVGRFELYEDYPTLLEDIKEAYAEFGHIH